MRVPCSVVAALFAAGAASAECDEGPLAAALEIAGDWVEAETGRSARPLPDVCIVGDDGLRMIRGGGALDMVALYDRERSRILLSSSAGPDDVVAISVLVHELVHHQQALHGDRFACAEARETVPYEVQEVWLARSGLTLERSFGIDRLTRFLLTTCGM